MGESSAFVSILVRSFSQNWGMIEDFSQISTALFLSVSSEMSFLGLKKKGVICYSARRKKGAETVLLIESPVGHDLLSVIFLFFCHASSCFL